MVAVIKFGLHLLRLFLSSLLEPICCKIESSFIKSPPMITSNALQIQASHSARLVCKQPSELAPFDGQSQPL